MKTFRFRKTPFRSKHRELVLEVLARDVAVSLAALMSGRPACRTPRLRLSPSSNVDARLATLAARAGPVPGSPQQQVGIWFINSLPHYPEPALRLHTSVNKRLPPALEALDSKHLMTGGAAVGSEPDYSRAALARFIEFVVEKNLVHPATAQGWRVATTKVLDPLPPASTADVRQIDVETTFRAFLNRDPGRLSPASVGEYRRRVGRAIEEFVRWMEDPGAYAFRGAARSVRGESRRRAEAAELERGPGERRSGERGVGVGSPASVSVRAASRGAGGISLDYPLRPDLLAQVVVPRDLTVAEARRMGAFLVTLAVDFSPGSPASAPPVSVSPAEV